MIKRLFTYPITSIITLLIVYTIYDYFEHIGRSGSSFEEHPLYWLLFTIAVVLSFILVVIGIKKGLENITKHKILLIEILSIGAWIALYLIFIGPLINKLFWPFSELYFSFSFGPFFIILTCYFILRMIQNLIIGKTLLYSK